jgi:hypothetical protein
MMKINWEMFVGCLMLSLGVVNWVLAAVEYNATKIVLNNLYIGLLGVIIGSILISKRGEDKL